MPSPLILGKELNNRFFPRDHEELDFVLSRCFAARCRCAHCVILIVLGLDENMLCH